ncbi:phage tail protein [Actinokineospora sp. NBRC 105648]|nr:phage tail protein [Actinokineospora sp. NBRC 105648]
MPSRHPIGERLPALYAEDGFTQRFTQGLDVVLAPVLSTLDNFAAYLSPRLTPADLLGWLGSWVATDLDPTWSDDTRRASVLAATRIHRWRGTGTGLVDQLWLCARVHARVLDGPGATWSREPGTDPARAPTRVVVQVWSDTEIELDRVEALVAAGCPMHVEWSVEVLAGPPEEET